MHYFPYKVHQTQELLDRVKLQHLSFVASFLNSITVDLPWPWNILWSDEGYFYLNGTVNTKNCRIRAKENSQSHTEILLQSQKVTVFEEIGAGGPMTRSFTGRRYNVMLQTFVVPQLLQRRVLASTIFMQDGAPSHIHGSVKALLLQHFSEGRVISLSLPNPWPPRSLHLTQCDFWLWGYLKSLVYHGGVATLNNLKNSIVLHVRSLTTGSVTICC
ncbi:transposable element tc3 transposase [Trichonephila clavipes]|nr:transposable element tc3 transposase [Trichonephila clavipes]